MIAWMERHYILTLLIVVWLLGLVSAVTLITWIRPPDIPGTTAAALGTVYGIVPITIGLWRWRRGQKAGAPSDSDQSGSGADLSNRKTPR